MKWITIGNFYRIQYFEGKKIRIFDGYEYSRLGKGIISCAYGNKHENFNYFIVEFNGYTNSWWRADNKPEK